MLVSSTCCYASVMNIKQIALVFVALPNTSSNAVMHIIMKYMTNVYICCDSRFGMLGVDFIYTCAAAPPKSASG